MTEPKEKSQSQLDSERIRRNSTYVKAILESFPVNMTEDAELKNTPVRVAKAWEELLRGYRKPDFTLTAFPTNYQGILLRTGIPFTSVCAHHMLLYNGQCDFGYIPRSYKVGISKITRFVRWAAARLTSQEELTQFIADEFMDKVKPSGVAVVLSAFHSCEGSRGIKISGVPTVTSEVRGIFKKDGEARKEFHWLIDRSTRLRQ